MVVYQQKVQITRLVVLCRELYYVRVLLLPGLLLLFIIQRIICRLFPIVPSGMKSGNVIMRSLRMLIICCKPWRSLMIVNSRLVEKQKLLVNVIFLRHCRISDYYANLVSSGMKIVIMVF